MSYNGENNLKRKRDMAMKFCVNCGTKLENNPRFCPGCGAPLAQFEEAAPAQEPVREAVYNEVPQEFNESVYNEVPQGGNEPLYKQFMGQEGNTAPGQGQVPPTYTAPNYGAPVTPPPAPKKNKKLIGIIAGVAVVVIALVIILASCAGDSTSSSGGSSDINQYDATSFYISGNTFYLPSDWSYYDDDDYDTESYAYYDSDGIPCQIIMAEEYDIDASSFDDFVTYLEDDLDIYFYQEYLGDWDSVYKAVSYEDDVIITTYLTTDGVDVYMIMFGAVDYSYQDEDLFDDIIASADVY